MWTWNLLSCVKKLCAVSVSMVGWFMKLRLGTVSLSRLPVLMDTIWTYVQFFIFLVVRMLFKISVDTLWLHFWPNHIMVQEGYFCDLIIVHRLCFALPNEWLLPVLESIAVTPADQTTSVFLSHFGPLWGCFLTVSLMLWDTSLTFSVSFNFVVYGAIIISFHQKQSYWGTKVLGSAVKTLVIYILFYFRGNGRLLIQLCFGCEVSGKVCSFCQFFSYTHCFSNQLEYGCTSQEKGFVSC